jgi:hypothetical protein
MSGYAKGVSPLTSQTTTDKRAYIDARAARINWSRAEFITQMVDFWLAMGAPALSEIESLAPALPIPEAARVPLRPYWAHLVAFEASDDTTKKPSAKDAARMILNRGRSGKQSKGTTQNPSSRSSHTRT